MKQLSIIIISIIILGCNSCNNSSSEREKKAYEMGQRDAQEFIKLYNASHKDELILQNFLLTVRDKERKLKTIGSEKGAENYINSFEATIQSVDTALYNEIIIN